MPATEFDAERLHNSDRAVRPRATGVLRSGHRVAPGVVWRCSGAGDPKDHSVRLQVFPPKVELSGPEAMQRLVVLAIAPDGKTRRPVGRRPA